MITGPSDSFHRDEQNPGQDQVHFQYPLVHVSRITERTGATHMPQQIDVRDHRKCNDHDSLKISQHGSRRIVTMIVCRHSAQYVGISTLPSDLTFLILTGCARMASRKPRVGQARQHRRLHHDDDLAGLGASHRESENAVVTPADKRLHKALSFAGRLRPQHSAHRQPRDRAVMPRTAVYWTTWSSTISIFCEPTATGFFL